MKEIEFLDTLDRYIRGKLNEMEKDELWKEFLKNPKYLDWLEIEVNARDYYRSHPDGDSSNPTMLTLPDVASRKSTLEELKTTNPPAGLNSKPDILSDY
ncbi:MAG: hypothetical protein WDZ36_04825 [Balneolaceae bacterium]